MSILFDSYMVNKNNNVQEEGVEKERKHSDRPWFDLTRVWKDQTKVEFVQQGSRNLYKLVTQKWVRTSEAISVIWSD